MTQKTINDFGEQWERYTDDDGYYASLEYFDDILEPLQSSQDYKGQTVLDIGSGSGRIVNMILDAGAKHIFALEPAKAAFETLKQNTKDRAEKITYLNSQGDEIPKDVSVDRIVSMGVLHHIPDPDPVMTAAYSALKPKGTCLAWLYGKEGNGLYLSLVNPLRAITTRIPHFLLSLLCHVLNAFLYLYILGCFILPLPMHKYAKKVLWNLNHQKRYLVIYDQLNPAYAKYYTKKEAMNLFEKAGFKDVQIHHRHGYSWTVLGTKE